TVSGGLRLFGEMRGESSRVSSESVNVVLSRRFNGVCGVRDSSTGWGYLFGTPLVRSMVTGRPVAGVCFVEDISGPSPRDVFDKAYFRRLQETA
ncbi:MAG TPA: hypothetical protein VKP30_09580, partial [Polyangiaceae bacterium]|nr:hypothetical protein [Polyangiaceae bacterium]